MSQISIDECDQKKYKGRVEIHGKIYLDQFFSAHKDGVGDADTLRIVLSPDSIKYRPSQNDKWQRGLTLFNNAYYYDEQEGNRKKVIIKDGKYHQDYIRIRLQGIDSPELHYKASQGDQFLYDNQLSKFKCLNDIFEFRQHFGARAAKELVELLKGYAKEENKRKFLYAYAFSLIDTPSNLFDRFGRAVADVVVSHNKTYDISDDNKNAQEDTDDINLNHWLVEEGWVFPDYYDSMSTEEIFLLQEKSKIASNAKKGIRSKYITKLVPLDYHLVFEKGETDNNIDADEGLINLPKFFRKQVDYEILKRCGLFRGDSPIKTLKKYIELRKTQCYKLDEFLEKRHCAQKYELAEFIDDDGSMDKVQPGTLVNIESDAQIETPNIINNWY